MIKIEIIKLCNVSKIYKSKENSVKALDNVSFTVSKGEFVAVMGESGSGKSTLLNILGCLDTATDGEYYLKGQKINALNERALCDIRNQNIGFIFQSFNLLPSLTAIDNIILPLTYRNLPLKECKSKAAAALKSVGLENRAQHFPCKLSGGQQQRVAVARALAVDPSVILADEPTGNLDSKTGNTIMELLCKLNKCGRTIILITHNNKHCKYADRTIYIKDGCIV